MAWERPRDAAAAWHSAAVVMRSWQRPVALSTYDACGDVPGGAGEGGEGSGRGGRGGGRGFRGGGGLGGGKPNAQPVRSPQSSQSSHGWQVDHSEPSPPSSQSPSEAKTHVLRQEPEPGGPGGGFVMESYDMS